MIPILRVIEFSKSYPNKHASMLQPHARKAAARPKGNKAVIDRKVKEKSFHIISFKLQNKANSLHPLTCAKRSPSASERVPEDISS
jgi:hypothetical protein